RVVTVRYKQKAKVTGLKGPTGWAYERLKIVFRYDLSPILTRLDDSVKRVPVPARDAEKVHFAAAPRLYRVPMKLSVTSEAGTEKREASIVLQRHGIARIVAASAEERAELAQVPALEEEK